MNRQVEIKAEQIARMVVAGMKHTKIAEQMNLSYSGLKRILECQDYKDIETKVRQTVVTNMDAQLAQRAQMRNELEDAVPDALKVLLDQVRTKRDLRAALEVLDRDPSRTLSKQTKVELNPQQTQMPQSILDNTIKEAEKTRDMLIRVPQQKVAQA